MGKKPFGKSRVQRAKRQPLRELTEAEVFERDEAVMGDLRRRRVSGENYLVDNLGDSVIFDVCPLSSFGNVCVLKSWF